jgi:hypothetical protein
VEAAVTKDKKLLPFGTGCVLASFGYGILETNDGWSENSFYSAEKRMGRLFCVDSSF